MSCMFTQSQINKHKWIKDMYKCYELKMGTYLKIGAIELKISVDNNNYTSHIFWILHLQLPRRHYWCEIQKNKWWSLLEKELSHLVYHFFIIYHICFFKFNFNGIISVFPCRFHTNKAILETYFETASFLQWGMFFLHKYTSYWNTMNFTYLKIQIQTSLAGPLR